MEKVKKVLIFADSREKEVLKELENYNCTIKKRSLIYGDYACGRVCIERKTAQDFIKSITDGRLFEQLKNLKDQFEKPLLIIEGNDLYNRLNPNVIRGALAAIAIDLSIPIIWTQNPAQTAGMIFWIAKREQEEKRITAIRTKRKTISQQAQQEFIIAGLPNVSTILAKRLLKHFKSIKAIFSASEKELTKVAGIGKKKAKKIHDIINSKYA